MSDIKLEDDEIIYTIDGKEEIFEEDALAKLLQDNVLFVNQNKVLEYNGEISNEYTITLYVNCSDVFAWGCADAMPLPCDELINLYKAWKSNNIWGSAIWCCKRRNEQPQAPVKKKMIDLGIWTEELEKLPENQYNKYLKSITTKFEDIKQ